MRRMPLQILTHFPCCNTPRLQLLSACQRVHHSFWCLHVIDLPKRLSTQAGHVAASSVDDSTSRANSTFFDMPAPGKLRDDTSNLTMNGK